MAKLKQLLTLESMLQTYDTLHMTDAWVIEKQGVCIEELVDDITTRLNRLLESKTRLSMRNVLLANFETMTTAKHWLKSRLFSDLPKEKSRVLRDKIEQMVELLKRLMLKIIDVEDEYADRFLKRVKEIYYKQRITDYEIWKKKYRPTFARLTQYQAELTAEMLGKGILAYDETPSGEEMEGVDMVRLRKKLKKGRELTEDFEEECAKLRRYSHWEGEMFIIDYPLLKNYLLWNFGKMTHDQHIDMYHYNLQMQMIHEDMKRMKGAEPPHRQVTMEMRRNEEALTRAIENCQAYFWGNSSYAVLFCICRDDYKMNMSQTDFERMVEGLPYRKKRAHQCPTGTIANAISNNPIYNEPVSEWDSFNPLPRVTKLRDELLKELKL